MDYMYTKTEMLEECNRLYHEIDNCITDLVKARLNDDTKSEQKVLFNMEELMCETLQNLSVIIDYIENKK